MSKSPIYHPVPTELTSKAARRQWLASHDTRQIPCDHCGRHEWAFIERCSTRNGRLLGERRLCVECAIERGWALMPVRHGEIEHDTTHDATR